ncbi:MAG: SDR family NAD(P)-dependent oxidoreductase [Rhodobacteraceae bacterium]|nr:SDR family NAD(P)-dependent oxidoreductase [Paracoccaceae bacterium]MCY4327409.1 SDR family NAD(P)-dependent oxidoreductase [Paracoccaceae bacterium]
MMTHSVIRENAVAVITGAASGIGLATARALSSRGMRIVLVDLDPQSLATAAESLAGPSICRAVDVADQDAINNLAESVFTEYGQVNFLMNNAAIRVAGSEDEGIENWHRTMQVNFWASVYAERAFLPRMIADRHPGIILNTGSKQGITNPPGNVIYNISKSALKTYTEQLQHRLRNIDSCHISAHLLVPGFTITGPHKPNPGGWSPEQLVAYMIPRLEQGDFYIICPDNEVTLELDAIRMEWAAQDIIDNRPPLSRWHPDWSDRFLAHLSDRN